MKRLKIILPGLGVGGTETHVSQVFPALKRRGWGVEVLLLSQTRSLAPALEAAGIPVKTTSLWALFWDHLRDRTSIRHYFLPKAYILGAFLGFLARQKAPEIMSRRSLNHYQKNYPGARCIECFLHTRMTRILGNSQAILKELVQEGVPDQKLNIIYNGIDVQVFRSDPMARARIRASLGVSDDTVVFITVANLIPYKGHSDILKALARLDVQNFLWLSVGRDDGIQTMLETEAATLGMREKIRFLGSRSDVAKLLSAADISILASHEEGLPGAVLESMAVGLPVIATQVGGIPEIIVPDKTGILVRPHDPSALAGALQDLCQDPPKRMRLGMSAHHAIQDLFSLEECVNAYAEFYEMICNERTPTCVA